MTERISTPHDLVAVHGTGRLADGDTVKQPPAPPVQPDRRLHRTVLACAAITLALTVAGIAGWLP